MTALDELWDLYADAVIECEIDGRAHQLRGPVAGPLPATTPIFVLTAYNPDGVPRDDALNAKAAARLVADLERIGATAWPATGRSRDASWSEPGVAVALDRERACELGRRYGQLAVFELTTDDVRVVRCLDGDIVRTRPRRQ